jgi:hypothetical protein
LLTTDFLPFLRRHFQMRRDIRTARALRFGEPLPLPLSWSTGCMVTAGMVAERMVADVSVTMANLERVPPRRSAQSFVSCRRSKRPSASSRPRARKRSTPPTNVRPRTGCLGDLINHARRALGFSLSSLEDSLFRPSATGFLATRALLAGELSPHAGHAPPMGLRRFRIGPVDVGRVKPNRKQAAGGGIGNAMPAMVAATGQPKKYILLKNH